MSLATIFYDPTNGDDGNSGSNVPTTAVSGANGDMDIGQTKLIFNETKNLTSVSGGGFDMLWFEGAAGDRHLFRVTAVDPGLSEASAIFTVETATATRSGVKWAVGGKRKTLINDTSQPDLDDAQTGWRFELGDGSYTNGATRQQTPNNIGDRAVGGGACELAAATGASAVITSTHAFAAIEVGSTSEWVIDGVTFESPNTAGGGLYFEGNNRSEVKNCNFNNYNNAIHFYADTVASIINCDIQSRAAIGIELGSQNSKQVYIVGCNIHDCNATGIYVRPAQDDSPVVIDSCIIRDNSIGIDLYNRSEGVRFLIKNCVIHGNSSDGVRIPGTGLPHWQMNLYMTNNIITDNGGYGINQAGALVEMWPRYWLDYNAFRGNTSGARNNVPVGGNDVTLTADPYTDETGDDYSLNNIAGGGAACRNVGFGRSS